MRIIVTGGAGYIGSRLVDFLLTQGHELLVIDRLDHGGTGVLPWLDHPRCRTFLRDALWWQPPAFLPADLIIHLAALVGAKLCDRNQDQAQRDNVELTKHVLTWGPPVISVSTCSNYGTTAQEATEETRLNPLSVYAWTKIEAEQRVLEAGGTALRLGTICGLSPRMRFDLLVNELAWAASVGAPYRLYGMDAWRPYLHVRDACRAIAMVINAFDATPDSPLRGEVFNVVGQNLTKRELVEMVKRLFPGFMVMEDLKDDVDVRDYRVSAEKIEKVLGFKPDRTVKDALVEVASVAPRQIRLDRERVA